MKVLQINSVCGVGSTGRIAVDISEKLNDEGIQNYIFYGTGQSEYKNAIKVGNKWDLRLHQLGTRLLGKHGFYSKKVTKELVKRIEKINPDIINLHNIHGHYLNVEILFKYLSTANKKVIWTLHDCWSFTGHCAYYDYVECSKWKSECNNCPALKEYPRSLIFDRSRESYRDKKEIFTSVKDMTLVTPSAWLAEQTKQSFLSKYPVKVINNGIDLSSFKPILGDVRKKLAIENKFMIVGVASVWERRKGLRYFIDLAENTRDDEIIVLVGLSKEQINELPKNIIGISRTNSVKELAEIYSTADVFINPTLEEVLGMTNIEALACGTPVITFNTGGSPECVDEKTGIIVNKGNLKQLRSAIDIVKSTGKEKYKQACIERVEQYYNKEDIFLEYVNLYKSKYNQDFIDS